jgi:hypothetical protein
MKAHARSGAPSTGRVDLALDVIVFRSLENQLLDLLRTFEPVSKDF